jgi:hypothetical protein
MDDTPTAESGGQVLKEVNAQPVSRTGGSSTSETTVLLLAAGWP